MSGRPKPRLPLVTEIGSLNAPPRSLAKWLYGLAAFIALTLTMQQFLAIYHFSDSTSLAIMLAVVCLTTVVIGQRWFAVPIYLLLYLYGVYRYFPFGLKFGLDWVMLLQEEIKRGFTQVGQIDSTVVPHLIAFSGLFLAALLLAVLIITYEYFLLSYSLLIGYLLTILVFNDLKLTIPLLIIAACGLLSFGLKHGGNQLAGKKFALFLLVMTGLLGLFAFAAHLIPENWVQEPLLTQSADLRTRLNSAGLYAYVERFGSRNGARIGFGEDDTQLGGALADDATTLFVAQQEKGHYWRVESKDQYTGKGWIDQEESHFQQLKQGKLSVKDEAYHQVYQEEATAVVTFFTTANYLPLPYGEKTIDLQQNFAGFDVFDNNQRINLLPKEGRSRQLKLTWREPEYDAESLGKVSENLLTGLEHYLQLPQELPKRIGELAQEITKDAENYYQKVQAIETYLKYSVDYRYSKLDAQVPANDQDYVDQFLFETKVGYCDNFSSSMVVMLRTLGIPARWTKGFTPGDPENNSQTNELFYNVKNRHAHSWPEVYFAGYGWVPFEPTPSFTNPDRPVADATTASEDQPTATTTSSSSQAAAESSTSSETTTSSSKLTEGNSLTREEKRSYWWVIGLGVTALAGLFCAWRFGLSWKIAWYLRFSHQPLVKSYLALLQQAHKLLPRPAEESLKNYAARFAQNYPVAGVSFQQLTQLYERQLYSDQPLSPMTDSQRALLQQAAKEMQRLKSNSREG